MQTGERRLTGPKKKTLSFQEYDRLGEDSRNHDFLAGGRLSQMPSEWRNMEKHEEEEAKRRDEEDEQAMHSIKEDNNRRIEEHLRRYWTEAEREQHRKLDKVTGMRLR